MKLKGLTVEQMIEALKFLEAPSKDMTLCIPVRKYVIVVQSKEVDAGRGYEWEVIEIAKSQYFRDDYTHDAIKNRISAIANSLDEIRKLIES